MRLKLLTLCWDTGHTGKEQLLFGCQLCCSEQTEYTAPMPPSSDSTCLFQLRTWYLLLCHLNCYSQHSSICFVVCYKYQGIPLKEASC